MSILYELSTPPTTDYYILGVYFYPQSLCTTLNVRFIHESQLCIYFYDPKKTGRNGLITPSKIFNRHSLLTNKVPNDDERTFNFKCIWHRVKVFIGDCGGTQNKYAICELKCAAMGFYIDGQGKRLPNSHSSYPRSCLIGIQITLFRVIISALKAIKLEISDAFPEKITRLREGRRST